MTSELAGPSSSDQPQPSEHAEAAATTAIELSVVMPCLDEEDSVAICVHKAWEGIRATGLRGEVIVADNGSSDRSVEVALEAGARVVHQPSRGYGNACIKGFSVAQGRIVVMGDCDDSYDFTKIPELIQPIADGYDQVLGSRFAGLIRPNAMTWSHRRIGNPALTAVLNLACGLKVSDAHSGFRAITSEALDKIGLESGGMEFASEMIVKAARANLRTAEIPITYHPRIGVSKLNPLRDSWRHLRLLFLYVPDYVVILAGLIVAVLGLVGQLCLLAAPGDHAVVFGRIALAVVALVGFGLIAAGMLSRARAKDASLSI